MKKLVFVSLALLCLTGKNWAQNYSPILTTGYNLDAVAENTTATSTTGGPVDGSNNIMYSYTYGQLYSSAATGVPNNGIVSSSTRTFQLQQYTQNNTLYIPTSQTDSLLIVTPAPYPTISLLAFATEGAVTMDVKLRFTDGTTQTFTNISLPDWFTSAPNVILTGYDRASRSTGTPGYSTTKPYMYYYDLDLSCANSVKNLQSITVKNNGTNPRICVMAVSGGSAASYTVVTTPVTCSGGNNGSANITISGGVPSFTFTWGTNPVINTGTVSTTSLLPVGTTNYTVTDASGCNYVSSVSIGQAFVAQPPLNVTASSGLVCAGDTVVLSTSGASTYTWSNNLSTSTTTVAPQQNGVYTVVGTTSANCTVTGSVSISVNPLPAITFTCIPPYLCQNAGGQLLTADPVGGTFSGPGISFGLFFPNNAGLGTQTVSYQYTDANGCTAITTVSTIVSTPTTVIAFTVTPSSICVHSPSIALNATPPGGVFTGTAVIGSSFTPSLSGVGTRSITYTYTDANNCSAKKVSAITVTACATGTVTGIEEISSALSCQLYPNPNNGSFTLKADVDLTITIINQLGQSLQTFSLDKFNSHEVYIESLAPGIYFLKAQDMILNQKIVVTQH